ncbi:MAG: hypothetical protein AB2768_13590 [Candidatus Thiodiazotropha endolucinida]
MIEILRCQASCTERLAAIWNFGVPARPVLSKTAGAWIGMLNFRLRRRGAPNQEYPDDGVRVVVAPKVPCMYLGMKYSPLSGGNDFAT